MSEQHQRTIPHPVMLSRAAMLLRLVVKGLLHVPLTGSASCKNSATTHHNNHLYVISGHTVPLCMVQGRTSSAGVICNRSAIFRIPGLDPTTMLLGIYGLAQQSRSLLAMLSSDDLQCCTAASGTLPGWERALCGSWTAPNHAT